MIRVNNDYGLGIAYMYITGDTRRSIMAAAVLGICIILGLATAGYLIGEGAARFKSQSRTVTVKGIAEKEVKADRAVWSLNLRHVGNDFKEAHAKINANREATITFLRRKGFKDDEIDRHPTTTEIARLAPANHDNHDSQQGQPAERYRYAVTTAVVVKTGDVDRVRTAVGATEELLKRGIVINSQREGNEVNPRYVISSYTAIQPQLFNEATKNAIAAAQQLAADAGVSLGAIRSASHGMIQILGADGNDESGPPRPSSSLTKRIRVVSTFEFNLQ
jgi:hypothetical protein